MAGPGWSLRRRGSPFSRWLWLVGGPLAALTLLTLFVLHPDPILWQQIVAVLLLPGTFIGLVLLQETSLSMRRIPGRSTRSRRKRR